MQKQRNQKGFTLIEIMIVVGIIGILASIAIPYYMKSRLQANAKSCINNLRIMEDAKAQYAIENKKTNEDSLTLSELTAYLRNPQSARCPTTEDEYTINGAASGVIGDPITCPNYNPTSKEFSTHKIN